MSKSGGYKCIKCGSRKAVIHAPIYGSKDEKPKHVCSQCRYEMLMKSAR